MEETYNIKAIILNRKSFSECDSRVVVYSRENGKLELTARGAKKIKSKLAGHLEPISLTDIMVIRGRRYDYVGAAVSENYFSNIKNDLAKLILAGRAVKVVEKLIKPGLPDEKIFELLKDYFKALAAAKDNFEMAIWFFILKFMAELGHQPELSVCLNCGKKILPEKNRFDLARGGLVCGRCADFKDANQPASPAGRLAVSDDGIKLLRLALKCNFERLAKVKISKKLGGEAGEVIDSFFKYNF